MATKKKKLNKRRGRQDLRLGKALYELNKIFSQEELSKKFKISKYKIRTLKKKKRTLPIPKKKREKILSFYRLLKKERPRETQRYHYRIKEGRIQPFPDPFIRQLRELIETKKIPKKEIAKELGVSIQTIKDWLKRKRRKIRKREVKEKLFKLSREKLEKERLAGLFFTTVRYHRDKRKRKKPYPTTIYEQYFYGTPEEFRARIETRTKEQEYGEVKTEKFLIAPQGKFKKEDVLRFIKYLEEIKDIEDYEESYRNLRAFIENNFKGKDKEELLKELRKYAP